MSQLEFYWKVVTYAGDTYLITPTAATKIQQAIARKDRHVNISQNGKTKTIAVSDIRLVDETDIAITAQDERSMVESGDIDLLSHNVLTRIDEDGNEVVRWRWAKQHVSAKKCDELSRTHYKLGSYYNTDGVWAAFEKPLEENQVLGDGVEWCTPEEVKRLDVMVQKS